MAISSRGEMGVGGGSRGGFGGGGASKSKPKLTVRQKAGKAIVNATTGKTSARKYEESKIRENAKPKLPSRKPKPLAEPRSGVKVIPPMAMDQRVAFNMNADAKAYNAKSGAAAKNGPAAMPKNPSYWQLKNLPSLVKINSGTGNKTVSPITYRGKATKKAAPARRATGRKSN